MSKENIQKTVAELKQRVEQLERANVAVQPEQTPSELEVAQAQYEAALKAFNTQGGVSLNSAAPPGSVADILKEEKPKG